MNTQLEPTTAPIVHVKDGDVFANSRDVAAYFDKRHDNVMRDISNIVLSAPQCALNFEETSETVVMPKGGRRKERAFNMDRDGFTLLAMGFTGKKAIKFKMDYIAAFNRMEEELNRNMPDFNNTYTGLRFEPCKINHLT